MNTLKSVLVFLIFMAQIGVAHATDFRAIFDRLSAQTESKFLLMEKAPRPVKLKKNKDYQEISQEECVFIYKKAAEKSGNPWALLGTNPSPCSNEAKGFGLKQESGFSRGGLPYDIIFVTNYSGGQWQVSLNSGTGYFVEAATPKNAWGTDFVDKDGNLYNIKEGNYSLLNPFLHSIWFRYSPKDRSYSGSLFKNRFTAQTSFSYENQEQNDSTVIVYRTRSMRKPCFVGKRETASPVGPQFEYLPSERGYESCMIHFL